ncbi:MAG: hypothetical protein MJZ66_09710 [Bacteroidales bacterium]|nr:hypothetical protein [Bacteroidales bacterium]
MKPIYESNPAKRYTNKGDMYLFFAVADCLTQSLKRHYVRYGIRAENYEDLLMLLVNHFGEDNISYEKSEYGRYYYVALPNMDFLLEKTYVRLYQESARSYSHSRKGPDYDFYFSKYTSLKVLAEKIIYLNDQIPHLIELADGYRLDSLKSGKKRELNTQTIKMMVQNALKGTGCRYKLEFDFNKADLYVTLDRKLYTKLEIPFDEIPDRIVRIVPLINDLNRIMKEFNQPLRIKGQQSYADWTESE